ncbi:MAG: 5-(carboxyamino)imidazole ribonucleotide synthase [Chloroflexota bacterium]
MTKKSVPSPNLLYSPPATIGILGSGQLGRMLALAARQMGYRVHVLSPGRDTPTGQVADRETTADYLDLDAIAQFAQNVDVVTYEFENVPSQTAVTAAQHAPLHPGPQALHVAQNRLREKQFFVKNGLPVAPFTAVYSLTDLLDGLEALGVPAVLKTASSGYDGKGQEIIRHPGDAEAAFAALNGEPAILESFINFEREVSMVAARGQNGEFAHYGLIANDHANHILDISAAPAAVEEAVTRQAEAMVRTVLEALDVIGVLCVEFFLTSGTTADGRLLLNEIAPRPHNSGHLTIEACETSQFEQQLRAICGLPLGETHYRQAAAMANILGDMWQDGPPDWTAVLQPGIHLHLYGKLEARPGRKMGHITALAETAELARQKVLQAREVKSKK